MPESIIHRTCTKCNQTKPAQEFYSYAYECKTCSKARNKEYRQTPSGKASRRREHARYKTTDNGKLVIKKKMQRFKERHPERVKARMMIMNRVYKGTIERPHTCSQCGAAERIQAHHHRGYARQHWLDVIWVCEVCHKRLETERRLNN